MPSAVTPPDVLVVSYRRPELVERCLQALAVHAPAWPVHVWDNASEDSPRFRELSADWPDIDWHYHEENIGFAAAVNRLAERTAGDLLLLNPDAALIASPLALVERLATDPTVAAVGPMVEVTRLQPWDNARRMPGPLRMSVEYWGASDLLRGTPLSQRYRRPPRRPGYISGACLLIRRSAWVDVGPFDEQFWLYSEEVDWARRARAKGWHLELLPQRLVEHVGGASSEQPTGAPAGRNWLFDMQLAFLAKHHGPTAAWAYRTAARTHDAVRRARRSRRS
jgi:GT2 family glycosyltransferase